MALLTTPHSSGVAQATLRPGAASLTATAPGAQFIHHRGHTQEDAR
ncbi:DUF6380 family protein [Streptomyces roseirectus]